MAGRRPRTRRKRTKKPKRSRAKARAAAKHSHLDAGPDRIVCLLCGEEYRVINAFHLRAKHGFEGDHPVVDYKQQFGLQIAVCEEVQERAREVQIDYHTREGRHLTRDQVLGRIRALATDGRPLARSRVPGGLSDAGIRIFGSWDGALRAAGEDPRDHRLLGGWTREAILEWVRKVAADAPMTDGRACREHQRLYGLAMGAFGAWSRALEAAGLDPDQHRAPRRHWTMDEAEAWVREQHEAGESIRATDAPSGLTRFVARATGQTWVAFVTSLGIAYPPYAGSKRWSDADVLRRIRARRRRGAAMNNKSLRQDGEGALVRQGRQRFGSWDAALEAAGIDPEKVRLTRSWTRRDVIEAIRQRHSNGLSLRQKDVFLHERRLVVAASKLWRKPLPWRRALRSAGFKPEAVEAGALPRRRSRRRKSR